MESKIDNISRTLSLVVEASRLGKPVHCLALAQEIYRLLEQPQDADLREILRGEAFTIDVSGEDAATGQMREVDVQRLAQRIEAAGYHKCPKEPWPILGKLDAILLSGFYFHEGAKAQRDADMKRCPAQEEG